MIYSDGYLILKSENNDNRILLIDLETSIVRDIITSSNITGKPCYHNDSSDAFINSGNELVNNGTTQQNLNDVFNMVSSTVNGFDKWFNGFTKNLGTDEGFARFAEDLMGSGLITIAMIALIVATGPLGIIVAASAIGIGVLIVYMLMDALMKVQHLKLGNGWNFYWIEPYSWFWRYW